VRLTDLAGRLEPEIWVISQLAPGQHVRLQDRPLKFDHAFLLNLSDETQLEFEFQAFGEGEVPLAVASGSELAVKRDGGSGWGAIG